MRSLFDAVIEKFPETNTRLAPSAPVEQDTFFESGIVKI